MIYLDHAATTPIDPRVLKAMLPYMTYEFGNPGSLHNYGRAALEAVEHARGQVAGFFHCDPHQVFFTSGGSEGNNTVFHGIEAELRRRNQQDIIISGIEHDSVWKPAMFLGQKNRTLVSVCPPDTDGKISLDAIRNLDHSGVGLVSVMVANNETGIVNDTIDIGDYCHSRGILFHSDAVQAAGIEPLDTADVFKSTDFMTVSAHKINGPKGVGALFARDPHILTPLILGGAEQEFGFRGGTENVAGIVGFGKACELVCKEYSQHLRKLTEYHTLLIDSLKTFAEENSVELRINGNVFNMLPKTLNICLPGINAQTLLLLLDTRDVFLSAGSACRAHEDVPSRVLTAMGLSDEDARCSIRISISHLNTKDELEFAAHEIIDCAARLKSM